MFQYARHKKILLGKLKQLCQLLEISKTPTTALRPQPDGMVECLNHTLGDMLNCVGLDFPFSWDIILPSVVLAYNSSVQESTKQTPNSMVFGLELRLSMGMLAPVHEKVQPFVAESADKYVKQLQQQLEHVQDMARNRLQEAALKQKN